MDGLHTRAQLVAFDPARAGAGTVGTVLPRAEIAETAARGEFPATLLLDLDRIESDGGDISAQTTVAVDWDEDTLEQLLASTDDEAIALWFDEGELVSAFDDVEGHGLRQKAAVLAVAAAAAGVSAAPSLGGTVEPGGQRMGGITAPTTAPSNTPAPAAQPMGVARGLQQDAEVSSAMNTPSTPSTTPSGSDSSLPTGEIAGIAGAAGILLISAAGFGVTRKRTHPVQPA